jgi:hypothetical protein
MPNNLADTARKAYNRRRVYIPEWMQLAQWVAIGLIPIVLLISFVVDKDNGSSLPVLVQPDTTSQDIVENPSITTERVISLNKVSGGKIEVPLAALEAARRAGLAIWTGDWSKVAVDGPAPVTQSLYPSAQLGSPKVYSVGVNVVIFLFPLDEDADGTIEQTFQISVINDNGAWLFPSAAG